MDHIKKISTKIFKKASAGSKPKSRRDPKLRYSRSMPLRSSNDTEESYLRPRPTYRGEQQFPYDITPGVFDIAPEEGVRHEDPYGGWPQHTNENTIDERNDTKGSYPQRYPLIERNIVDQFPAPPSPPIKSLQPGVGIPKRPARPPTLDLEDYQFTEAELLPEMSPGLKAKMAAIHAENLRMQAEAKRMRARQGESIQRCASSASNYVRPLNINRHHDRSLGSAHGASNSLSTPQPGAGIYRNPAASGSTRSLDPHARYRTCLASSRRAVAAANHNNSQSIASTHSGSSIDGNTVSSQSTPLSLGPNARYHAALADTQAGDATPATTVRRRNASSGSSRSALSSRRNGMATAPTVPAYEEPAHQEPGLYHPDVMRVVRGPHGSKLQAPGPVRAGRDMGLEINDADRREFGIGGHGGAATVAGCGRQRGLASRR
ncbi:hypothetical protein FPV67DRAFT_1447860 [Lyophyllum atratum]|nr:hypothetical protein FPV67DRAFT_1447860 [Lyophyllum atratum]